MTEAVTSAMNIPENASEELEFAWDAMSHADPEQCVAFVKHVKSLEWLLATTDTFSSYSLLQSYANLLVTTIAEHSDEKSAAAMLRGVCEVLPLMLKGYQENAKRSAN